MGLEDFKSEDEHSIGNVSTRKKIDNVNLSEDDWKHLLYHNPEWAVYFANGMEEKSVKAMVEAMDELIEDGRRGVSREDELEAELEQYREEVVNKHLRD